MAGNRGWVGVDGENMGEGETRRFIYGETRVQIAFNDPLKGWS
jgi:hypothetical protein